MQPSMFYYKVPPSVLEMGRGRKKKKRCRHVCVWKRERVREKQCGGRNKGNRETERQRERERERQTDWKCLFLYAVLLYSHTLTLHFITKFRFKLDFNQLYGYKDIFLLFQQYQHTSTVTFCLTWQRKQTQKHCYYSIKQTDRQTNKHGNNTCGMVGTPDADWAGAAGFSGVDTKPTRAPETPG